MATFLVVRKRPATVQRINVCYKRGTFPRYAGQSLLANPSVTREQSQLFGVKVRKLLPQISGAKKQTSKVHLRPSDVQPHVLGG